MVLLGGLEIVAAGYLINKHHKNKKERARIEDERLKLEEEQYHLFPPQQRHHRSHSDVRDSRERRRSRERRNSDDRRDRRDSRDRKSRRDYKRPASSSPIPPYKSQSASQRPPVQNNPRPAQQPNVHPIPQHVPRPVPQAVPQPTPYPVTRPPTQAQPQAPPQQSYPPDIKYGWTDEGPSSQPQQQQAGFPPTGWPAHWEQSQRPEPSSRSPYQNADMSRERSNTRPNESRVRFAVPTNSKQPGERDSSCSPPPYKP